MCQFYGIWKTLKCLKALIRYEFDLTRCALYILIIEDSLLTDILKITEIPQPI